MTWRWIVAGYVGARIWTRYRPVRTAVEFVVLLVALYLVFR